MAAINAALRLAVQRTLPGGGNALKSIAASAGSAGEDRLCFDGSDMLQLQIVAGSHH
jgi:hypothetical protein